jgi:hypothetical protein
MRHPVVVGHQNQASNPMGTCRAPATIIGMASCLLSCSPPGPEGPQPGSSREWESRLPPLPAEGGLPPLPEASPRIASYDIEARLDPDAHTIDGRLLLTWRNTSTTPLDRFPFHLYWNAFRNSRSTSALGGGRRAARPQPAADRWRGFGYMQVGSVRLLGAPGHDLSPSLRYIQPDDGNPDDRTVAEVVTPVPVAPGETVRFEIEWRSQIPHGSVGRSGWVHDYHFIAQWFPKIGVHRNGEWSDHQFHATSEFFADFGRYDVSLTLPAGFVVGATGALENRRLNPDGTETFRFVQDDVHDFAWVAGRRLLERTARFAEPGYPEVRIRLLLQPEHAHLARRYLEATRTALLAYGTWSAPYPYAQLTVVDPAWGSASGGMEYPTLFTGGASILSPPELQSPEEVTIHEAGHQFWYGLVANDEFEEAWLDEGLNEYHEVKTRWLSLGPLRVGHRYFGLPERGSSGLPVVARGVWILLGQDLVHDLQRGELDDRMARRSWEYRTSDSYTLNSYDKPALTLLTLEALVGEPTMTRILRTYARSFRFRHPTTADFIAIVNQVTGRDYSWFFDETWFSSEACDYAVEVEVVPELALEGFVEGAAGRLVPGPAAPRDAAASGSLGRVESRVTVRRLGGVRLPVELLVEFADGEKVEELWDGQYRWRRFVYARPARVVRAVVDPHRKLAIDLEPANNAWNEAPGASTRAATKWGLRYMIWLQDLLELHALLG